MLLNQNKPKHTRAFTLIELSIVLVIIGLIVGGVLVGQDLIRASQLRKVLSEVESIKVAASAFRLKYNCLPGDCANATDFFTADTTCPRTGSGALHPATEETCNGNGNGQIWRESSDGHLWEQYLFWQHLSNAGLIANGPFSGFFCVFGGQDCGDKNVYPSSTGIGSITLNYVFPTGAVNRWNPHSTENIIGEPTGNYFMVGADINQNSAWGAIFTPIEMYKMDQKTDDSKPGEGRIRMFKSDTVARTNPGTNSYNLVGCTSTDVASTSEYSATNTNKNCALIMAAGF